MRDLGRSVAGVSIGVNRPGVLEPLRAAASSARQFHEWLLAQRNLGITVDSALLTDEAGDVTARNVIDAVSRVVTLRASDALFLYFSGHGVTAGGYDEKFLLSSVNKYPNEVINILSTRLDAKYC